MYGAFSFHSLIGALLLHPLKWHVKDAIKSKSSNDESLTKEDKNKILGKNCSETKLNLTYLLIIYILYYIFIYYIIIL